MWAIFWNNLSKYTVCLLQGLNEDFLQVISVLLNKNDNKGKLLSLEVRLKLLSLEVRLKDGKMNVFL
jgi:hypothetical protein